MSKFPIFQRAVPLLFVFVSLLGFLVFTSSCSVSNPATFRLTGFTMGTSYSITVVEQESARTDQKKLQLIVDTRLQTLNQQMSTYIPDSELSQFNRSLVDEPVAVSDELFDILMLSLELSWLSSGAFDVTVGPVVDLWGFGGGSDKIASVEIPVQAAIDEKLLQIGFQNMELNVASNTVTKTKDINIDLSGIAKGYGVDKIREVLEAAGFKNFMVEIGGELYLEGNSDRGLPWKIAIEKPDGSFGKIHRAVSISGRAMATSGDYRNYFEVAGVRYSHTIDPVSGRPIKHNTASVTVIAESAAYADGLATAINVMGADKGLQLAEQQNLAVYIIVKTSDGFEAKYSDAFKPYLN
ncbi:MAG: thiamine biosynthesis lipoprotein [Oceanicoccus sp.]|jgi:thiamine biosynthesis lipoprotein